MEQAPYADPMPVIPEVNSMWDAQKALFTFTWDGQLSVADAQAKAMETYDTSLMMAGKSRFWAD
jgi:maltose-binding protein MalE